MFFYNPVGVLYPMGVEVADVVRALDLLFGLCVHGLEPCKHKRKMDIGVTLPQKVAQ